VQNYGLRSIRGTSQNNHREVVSGHRAPKKRWNERKRGKKNGHPEGAVESTVAASMTQSEEKGGAKRRGWALENIITNQKSGLPAEAPKIQPRWESSLTTSGAQAVVPQSTESGKTYLGKTSGEVERSEGGYLMSGRPVKRKRKLRRDQRRRSHSKDTGCHLHLERNRGEGAGGDEI